MPFHIQQNDVSIIMYVFDAHNYVMWYEINVYTLTAMINDLHYYIIVVNTPFHTQKRKERCIFVWDAYNYILWYDVCVYTHWNEN